MGSTAAPSFDRGALSTVALGRVALRLAAPFHPLSRELLEMRWLWQQPLQLSNLRLCEVLGGDEPQTPWDEALRASLHTAHAQAG